jgi:uncharacterized SAM-binding protein YcdF (DUF218 family)
MAPDQVEQINDRLLFVADIPDKVDVAILLGNQLCSGDIARQVAIDFHNEHFQNIILCGGINMPTYPIIKQKIKSDFRKVIQPDEHHPSIQWSDVLAFGRTEAQHMESILRSGNVPPHSIVHTDNLSTNTGENFAFIADFIERKNYKTAYIYAGAYHARRGVETCKRWITDLDAHPRHVYPFGLSREQWLSRWPKDPPIGSRLSSEFHKLNRDNSENYYRQGFCTPVDIPRLG